MCFSKFVVSFLGSSHQRCIILIVCWLMFVLTNVSGFGLRESSVEVLGILGEKVKAFHTRGYEC